MEFWLQYKFQNFVKKNISLKSWLKSSFDPFPQKLTNIDLNFDIKKINEKGKKLIYKIIKKYSENTSENCRIYIRPSGTEPLIRILVEAKNLEKVNALSREITSKMTAEINKMSEIL